MKSDRMTTEHIEAGGEVGLPCPVVAAQRNDGGGDQHRISGLLRAVKRVSRDRGAAFIFAERLQRADLHTQADDGSAFVAAALGRGERLLSSVLVLGVFSRVEQRHRAGDPRPRRYLELLLGGEGQALLRKRVSSRDIGEVSV